MIFLFIRGATMYELQMGRMWIALRQLRFWRSSGPGFVRWTDD